MYREQCYRCVSGRRPMGSGRRWLPWLPWLGALALCGCIVPADGGGGDDNGDDMLLAPEERGEGEGDGGAARHPDDPEDVNLRFARAAVTPICNDGDPAARIVLGAGDPCEPDAAAADRLEMTLYAQVMLPFPFEPPVDVPVGDGRPLQGHYVDAEGDRLPLIDGQVTITRFDPIEGAAGRFEVFTVGWRRVAGAFAAGICGLEPGAAPDLPACFPLDWAPEPDMPPDEPEPEPAPPPGEPWPIGEQAPSAVVPCPGIFAVSRWTVDEAAFDTRFIQPLLDTDLADGLLVVDLRFTTQPDQLTLVDALAHGHGPAPEVPLHPPFLLVADRDDGFQTTPRGPFSVWLSASAYPSAQPLAWHLIKAAFAGRAAEDCSAVTVQYEALFDGRGLSIPAVPDGDADGDGRNESFRVYGTLEATRLPDL